MHADVQGLMQGDLGDWLAEQSTMRDEAREKAYSRWTWGAAFLLPALAFLWFIPYSLGDFKFWISAFAIGGVGAWGYVPISEAKKAIKVGINSAIARSLGIEYSHDVEPGQEFEACCQYGLVPSFDRSDFEDRWFGYLEGHGFELYEGHLEERRGSGKNRRWVTVFRGAVINMEFGRPFHSTTLLQRAGKHKKWFGLGGRKDSVKFDGHELAYVDQVHPAFEDVFEVWSDDQVEARVLVHPTYVEHLLALEKAFNGEAVRALFTKGAVVVAVESGNLFESGALNAEGDEERVAEAAAQFGALAELALAINQNERGRVMVDREREITTGDRRRVRRQAGGFGRKNA
ncbi:DUF3137 domain-containing protein [Erythrobacter sp. THAF29]|uniref:DUF3137 domain-containing protein n=1 Tax=Erythrobacter sp. THAF29 TaxID=2587851 RepID=UPI001267985F|nr:DUF3137 domain-containing protein [Erythrobacter sp. THAF29]QFT77616.1 hypothetical protein FIU90_08700 [Erythrobacter sp. THAF29]